MPSWSRTTTRRPDLRQCCDHRQHGRPADRGGPAITATTGFVANAIEASVSGSGYAINATASNTAIHAKSTNGVGSYYAIFGEGPYGGVNGAGTGVWGISDTSGYGVYGQSGANGYGVSGYNSNSTSGAAVYGFNASGGGWAGDFHGNARVTGTLHYGALVNDSDIRLKRDVKDVAYGLAQVLKLRPVTYSWKTEIAGNTGPQIGLIAQDVQKVIPERVKVGLLPIGLIGLVIQRRRNNKSKALG